MTSPLERCSKYVRCIRSRIEGDQGQVIVVVVAALFFGGLLGAAALAIDTGNLHSARERLQQYADAAALAGARDLPEPGTSGTCNPLTGALPSDPPGNAACSNAKTNLTNTIFSNVTLSWSNNSGDTSKLQVTVSADVSNFFAKTLGFLTSHVSATGVAKITAGSAGEPLALFAYDSNSSCSGGIDIPGNNVTVSGAVISNGTLSVTGNSKSQIDGSASYGGPYSCSGPDASHVTGTLTDDPNSQSYPETFGLPTGIVAGCCSQTQTAICTPGPNVYISGVGGATIDDTSPSGIYCSTGTISVTPGTSLQNAPNGVTLIAPTVDFSGGHGKGSSAYTLTPYYTDPSTGQKLLWYQNGNNPIDFPANGNSLTGVMFSPNATVTFEKNNTSNGVIEATDINFSKNNGDVFTGTGISIGSSISTILYAQ